MTARSSSSGLVFDGVTDAYDAARPTYPEGLFDDLVELTELEPGARLLEIGCGTGKATRPLLERGFDITCVEPGAKLAGRARANLAGLPVEVHEARFEEWNPPHAGFDLVYAAAAWHWLDRTVRFSKAHELLRPGGHLAFWSTEHAFPHDADPFFLEIQDVYDEIGEGDPRPWPPLPPDRFPDQAGEIESSRLFGDVRLRRHVWEVRYTADEYIALLDTFSGHISMEVAKRERLYAEIRRRIGSRPAGTVRRHWLALLHVARRA